MNHDVYGIEEEFHSRGERKRCRKERQVATSTDRSKFKKTDQNLHKKKIPSLENLKRGQVIAILSEGILVDAEGAHTLCSLKGTLKQENSLVKNLVAVGDFVHFSEAGSIAHVEERRSILSRADNLSRKKQQLIAVNIDQVLITASLCFPALKPFLVDRYIIAARKGNMDPIVVVNKVDLFSEAAEEEKMLYLEFVKAYGALGIPIICVSTTTGEGFEALKTVMHQKTSVFSGQSGVGKSSLINAVTGTRQSVGELVERTNKGSHTTTTTHLLPVEGGGFCIDTPGIKSFGVWDLTKEDVIGYFPEMQGECKYPDCRHSQEPGCVIPKKVENQEISPLRFASYLALMASISQEHRNR